MVGLVLMRTWIGAVAVLAAAVVVTAAAARVHGGLAGTVVQGANRPSCTDAAPCTKPVAGVTLSFVRGGQVVAHTLSDSAGDYTVALGPGTYAVRASVGGAVRRVVPATVRIADAAVLHRRFLLVPAVQIETGGGPSRQ